MQTQGGFEPTTVQKKGKKNQKKVTFTGFDPRTFRFQEQNTTTELRRHVTLKAL